VGIGFSVREVVRFGQALLEDADALVKMSDKTGISLQGLQKFQIAGDDAGNTIDQLTMAVNQMQKRLVGDDASAVAGLQKLGLSFSDIKALAPDAQFMTIASAIRGIKDPAEQVAIAMAIFGRNGAEVLPTIKRGFDDLKDASVGMADETVKNLDAVGDAFDRMWRAFKGGTADAVVGLWKALAQAEGSVVLSEGELAGAIQLTAEELATIHAPQAQFIENVKASSLSASEEAAIIKDLNRQLDAMQPALKAAAAADEAVTAAMKAHWNDVGTILDRVMGVEALKVASNWMDAIDAMGGSIANLSNKDLADLDEAMMAGVDAMARNGTLTDGLSSKMIELALRAKAAALGVKAVADEIPPLAAVENQLLIVGNAVSASIQGTAQSFAGLTVNIAATNDQMSAFYANLANHSNVGTPGADNIGVPSGGVGNLASAAAGSVATLNRIPRFDDGGPTRAGLAFLHDREYVVPSGGALVMRGGGGGTHVVVNINGSVLSSKDELARAIADALEYRTRGGAVRMASGA